MSRPIPVTDPREWARGSLAELESAFRRVMESGRYMLGPEVAGFEQEWADACDTTFAVGTSSGTDALALALRALGVEPGDEVLVPAMTALPTWMAVAQIGAVPVGVDVDPQTGSIDPALVPGALRPRTRALVAVHLFGHPANVDGLRDALAGTPVALVEDAAQAHGSTFRGRPAGSLGDAAAFSFYPTKNLGAFGDAGAVTTSDPQVADRLRLLREYGWRTRSDSELKGVNARLDELQAALLRVMLTRLGTATTRRREIAASYLVALEGIEGLELLRPPPESASAWHLFVVRHPKRDAIVRHLAAAGVGTAVHYTPPPHLNSALRADGWGPGDFPVAEHHAATAVTLPLHPTLEDDDVLTVIEAVRAACRAA